MDLTPGPPGTANYGFVDDTDTGMSRTAANTLGFLTAGVTGMHITSAHQVGIGTASPVQKLNVAGNISAQTELNLYLTREGKGCGGG